MLGVGEITVLQRHFRELFLEELQADAGWSAYIDELVRHIDLSGFDYLQSGGVPYLFKLSEYLGTGDGDSIVSLTSVDGAGQVFAGSDAYYVVLNAPRGESSAAWLDFVEGTWVTVPQARIVYVDSSMPAEGNVSSYVHTSYVLTGQLLRPSYLKAPEGVFVPTYDVASQLYSGGVLNVGYLGNTSSAVPWEPRVKLTTYSTVGDGGDQPCMVVIRVPFYVESEFGVPLEVAWDASISAQASVYDLTEPQRVVGSDGSVHYYIPTDLSLVGLQVDGIPWLVNGAMVRASRGERGIGKTLYGVSPSARGLFETMYGLGLDYVKFPFQFYLSSSVSLGDTVIPYPHYVSIREYLNPLSSSDGEAGGPAVWDRVSWGYSLPVGSSFDVAGFVASECTPTDASRDRWGVDSDGVFKLVDSTGQDTVLRNLYNKYGHSIFGYDKKLWVVLNNGDGGECFYLGGPFTPRGGLTVLDGWDKRVRFDAGGTVMAPPSFRIESDVSEIKWVEIESPSVLNDIVGSGSLSGDVVTIDSFEEYTRLGGFVIGTPSNGGSSVVRPLMSEGSHPFVLPEGVTKHYGDLSLQEDALSRVDRLTVAFTGTKSAFGARLVEEGRISSLDVLDAYLEWLKGVLERSVPIGIDVEIIFITPPTELDLDVAVVTAEGDGVFTNGGPYLLVNPTENHIIEGIDILYSVVVRSDVSWWVDMKSEPVLGVRLAGGSRWEKSIDVDVTDGSVGVELYAGSTWNLK